MKPILNCIISCHHNLTFPVMLLPFLFYARIVMTPQFATDSAKIIQDVLPTMVFQWDIMRNCLINGECDALRSNRHQFDPVLQMIKSVKQQEIQMDDLRMDQHELHGILTQMAQYMLNPVTIPTQSEVQQMTQHLLKCRRGRRIVKRDGVGEVGEVELGLSAPNTGSGMVHMGDKKKNGYQELSNPPNCQLRWHTLKSKIMAILVGGILLFSVGITGMVASISRYNHKNVEIQDLKQPIAPICNFKADCKNGFKLQEYAEITRLADVETPHCYVCYTANCNPDKLNSCYWFDTITEQVLIKHLDSETAEVLSDVLKEAIKEKECVIENYGEWKGSDAPDRCAKEVARRQHIPKNHYIYWVVASAMASFIGFIAVFSQIARLMMNK
eukprot:NODE_395_length_8134_cov_0.767393.p2 type:complete len:385 gc:universal NODE_395_length_8134_cov_0.767393:1962-3116(+)